MGLRVRSLWLALAAVLYVGFAALQAAGGRGLPWLAIAALPIALVFSFRWTEPREGRRAETTALAATRVAVTGACVLAAARTSPPTPGLLALENVGVAVASMAALVAVARVASLGGLLEPRPAARRLDAAAFGALLWTVAIALPAIQALWPSRAADAPPWLVPYATLAASIGALGLALAATARLFALRRLELGVGDRARAALALTATALLVSVLASAAGLAPPERLLPVGATVAALLTCWTAIAEEPTTVARALRVTLAAAILAGPFALAAVFAAHAFPGRAAPAVFVACVAAAVAGIAAPLAARRFAPLGARWLDAFDAATRAAMNPDPDRALEAALMALRDTAGRAHASPSLFRISPPEAITIDRGGFVHVERAELPAALVELAGLEPEQVLRLEALRGVEVRRPEVRPVAAWLEQRGIAAAAIVRDDDEPIAALAIAGGSRRTPMSLDEARALGTLAARLGAVVGVSSMLARSRERELAERARAERLEREVAEVRAALERDARRLDAIATSVARPARVASYGPASRTAVEQLERLAAEGRPIALLTAPGIDAAAWAALAHLASPRKGALLVVVEGTSPEMSSLELFRDPERSPLRAAAGGTLVILDADALPRPVQSYVAVALGEDTGLVASLPSTVDALVAAGRLDERLADRLGDRAVALPTLAARGEDLRALALDHLARVGVKLRGRPIGLDPYALARLGEHVWPGNDAELASVLVRAALVAEGDTIGRRDLDAAGFAPIRSFEETPRPPPIPTAKRSKRARA